MSDDKRIQTRDWLNPDDVSATAFITTYTELYSTDVSIESSIKLADCSRNISLDFSVYSPSFVKKYRRKEGEQHEYKPLDDVLDTHRKDIDARNFKFDLLIKRIQEAKKNFNKFAKIAEKNIRKNYDKEVNGKG